jgi:ribosomal protein L7/L12
MTQPQLDSVQKSLYDLANRIARIEQFLASSGFQPVSDAVPGDQNELINGVPAYLVEMVRGNNLIGAIKEYRTLTGAGLKQAKEILEQAARY